MNIPRGFLRAGVAMLPLALAAPAQAVDLAWSGFGTLGYAQSDQPVNYQRFIDEKGTFKRDSVLGAQVDARLNTAAQITVCEDAKQLALCIAGYFEDVLSGTCIWKTFTAECNPCAFRSIPYLTSI